MGGCRDIPFLHHFSSAWLPSMTEIPVELCLSRIGLKFVVDVLGHVRTSSTLVSLAIIVRRRSKSMAKKRVPLLFPIYLPKIAQEKVDFCLYTWHDSSVDDSHGRPHRTFFSFRCCRHFYGVLSRRRPRKDKL